MDSREALIASTQELLWDRGYSATSPKAILRHSGVGHGSLYHHFEGKRDLAHIAITRLAERTLSRVNSCFAGPGASVDKIIAYLSEERDILRGCPLGRLTADPEVFSSHDLLDPIEKAIAHIRMLLTSELRKAIEEGDLPRSLEADSLADTIASCIQGAYVLARASHTEPVFRNAVAGLIGMIRSLRENSRQNQEGRAAS